MTLSYNYGQPKHFSRYMSITWILGIDLDVPDSPVLKTYLNDNDIKSNQEMESDDIKSNQEMESVSYSPEIPRTYACENKSREIFHENDKTQKRPSSVPMTMNNDIAITPFKRKLDFKKASAPMTEQKLSFHGIFDWTKTQENQNSQNDQCEEELKDLNQYQLNHIKKRKMKNLFLDSDDEDDNDKLIETNPINIILSPEKLTTNKEDNSNDFNQHLSCNSNTNLFSSMSHDNESYEHDDIDIHEGGFGDEEDEVAQYLTGYNKIKNDYIEDEAQLSGSEAAEDDSDGSEDYYEIDPLAEHDKMDENELNQLGKIHRKVTLDQDKREIRTLQEIFFEDADDPENNKTKRVKKFQWNFENLDNNKDFNLETNENNDGSDELEENASKDMEDELDGKDNLDLDFSLEFSRRKFRFEREQWLNSRSGLDTNSESTAKINVNDQDIDVDQIGKESYFSIFRHYDETLSLDYFDSRIENQNKPIKKSKKETLTVHKENTLNIYKFLKSTGESSFNSVVESNSSSNTNFIFRKLSPSKSLSTSCKSSPFTKYQKNQKISEYNHQSIRKNKKRILKNSIFNYF
ncbi:unnamed protein product [Gordionus sp. m RMFG-2023]